MTGHIFIYGGIGSGAGEVSLNQVKNQIDPAASDYVVHIVSPGGDVFEGYGIYNILKNTGKPVVTHIEGLCASIATLIAFAGSKIVMNKTSEFMIHNPKISDLKGESSDLRNVADQLDKIKSLLIDVSGARAARNGKPIQKEELWALYDSETWLTGTEAVERGFADEVVDAIKAVAKVDLTKFTMKKNDSLWAKFTNMLQMFKNAFTETLANGQVIVVESEDEDWTGKKVMYEDGTPVPAGDHELATGKVISVDDTSTITLVKEAPAPADKQQSEEMDNKIKELEAQLAEAKSAKETAEAALTTAQATATQATAKAAKFENRVSAIEKEFLKLKEEAGQTVGDKKDPKKGPVFKNTSTQDETYDPMGEEAMKYFRNRNMIAQNED
jgi:ATP-dependent protease ClpP protease subunit